MRPVFSANRKDDIAQPARSRAESRQTMFSRGLREMIMALGVSPIPGMAA